jgi:hypothetical protein
MGHWRADIVDLFHKTPHSGAVNILWELTILYMFVIMVDSVRNIMLEASKRRVYGLYLRQWTMSNIIFVQ